MAEITDSEPQKNEALDLHEVVSEAAHKVAEALEGADPDTRPRLISDLNAHLDNVGVHAIDLTVDPATHRALHDAIVHDRRLLNVNGRRIPLIAVRKAMELQRKRLNLPKE